MSNHVLKEVGVVGAGAMGSQIAFVSALAGFDVVLHDCKEESIQRAKKQLHFFMEKRVEKGLHSKIDVEKAFERMKYTTDLLDMENVDLVVESIVEKVDEKRKVFSQLDQVLPKKSIIGTNSSTIGSSKLADATMRPEKVCNIHFFNPVVKMELVEIVRGEHTSEETVQAAMEYVKAINKTPILLQKEIPGFVANRILGSIFGEAIFLLENGYASCEEIDLVVTKALGHSIGPFRLLDFVGIDVSYNAKLHRYNESGDERDRPSKLIEKMVKEGHLGRKTGRGFYRYE